MAYFTESTLVLTLVAVACAIPGTFLVLRRMSLTSDAIGHVLLLGIVVAYFVVRDLDSPWLLVGAAATGVLTVALVEALQKTRLVKEDAAIGLVFPALFALGVLLATLTARNIHLDVDQVLFGQPEFASYPRWRLGTVAVTPLWVMAGVLVLNAGLATLFFKELKLTTFDPGLAASLGFRPGLMHYGLMTVVSLTAVAAFDAVGPVLVIGFFVVPAAAAYLLTDRLAVLLLLAAIIGAVGAVGGAGLAVRLDTSTAGAVAAVLGVLFGLAFVAAPRRGLIAQAGRRVRQRRAFEELMLLVHLLHHEGTADEAEESRLAGLHTHLNWVPTRVAAVVVRATEKGLIQIVDGRARLTDPGRSLGIERLGKAPRGLRAGS